MLLAELSTWAIVDLGYLALTSVLKASQGYSLRGGAQEHEHTLTCLRHQRCVWRSLAKMNPLELHLCRPAMSLASVPCGLCQLFTLIKRSRASSVVEGGAP
jgi:hypothetical protein